MEKVKQYISNVPLSQEVIEKVNLKLEALSNLSRSQVKYLKMVIVKGMLSTESFLHPRACEGISRKQ